MTAMDGVFDEGRETLARLAAQSRWGEADAAVELAIGAGHGQQVGGLVHVPGGLGSASTDALTAVLLTNRGADREAALAAARRALAAPRWQLESFWLAVTVLFAADEITAAARQLRRAWENLGRAVPSRDRDALALLSGRLAALGGEPGRAAELLAGALDRGVRTGLRDLALAWRVAALADVGDVEDAYDDLLDAGFAGALDGVPERIDLLAARAALHAAADRLDLAYADWLACGRALGDRAVTCPAVVPWRSRAALCVAALGRTAFAGALARQESVAAERWGTRRAVGMATHALAVAVGGDLPLLRRAEAELAGSKATGELLRVRHDLALALAAAGHRDEAVRLVEKVRESAENGGFPLWKQRADVTWQRVTNGIGVGALTSQERKIAVLARAGYSNRRIAEEQSLTLRTVEFHLSGAYRKLGIAGRRELMTLFSRLQ